MVRAFLVEGKRVQVRRRFRTTEQAFPDAIPTRIGCYPVISNR